MPFLDFLFKKVKKPEEKKQSLNPIIHENVDPYTKWEEMKAIGDGAFGQVYQVQDKEKGTFAAMKRVKRENDEDLEDALVEVDIIAACVHKNIIAIYDAYLTKDFLWIMIEFCDAGALDSIMLDLDRPLNEAQIRFVCHEMVDGLAFLHRNFVIHRDLKAGNILLKMDGQVKLADFGVSAKNKEEKQKRETYIGSPYWMAPEVIYCETYKDEPYDYKADVWSLGITLIELAQMNPPNHEMNPGRAVMKIYKAEPPRLDRPSQWSAAFQHFLERCLVKSPASRASMEQLQGHEFILHVGEGDRKHLCALISEAKAEVQDEVIDLDQKVLCPDGGMDGETVSLISSDKLLDDSSSLLTSAESMRDLTVDDSLAASSNLPETKASGDDHPQLPVVVEDPDAGVKMGRADVQMPGELFHAEMGLNVPDCVPEEDEEEDTEALDGVKDSNDNVAQEKALLPTKNIEIVGEDSLASQVSIFVCGIIDNAIAIVKLQSMSSVSTEEDSGVGVGEKEGSERSTLDCTLDTQANATAIATVVADAEESKECDTQPHQHTNTTTTGGRRDSYKQSQQGDQSKETVDNTVEEVVDGLPATAGDAEQLPTGPQSSGAVQPPAKRPLERKTSRFRTLTRTRKFTVDGQEVVTQTTKLIDEHQEEKNQEKREQRRQEIIEMRAVAKTERRDYEQYRLRCQTQISQLVMKSKNDEAALQRQLEQSKEQLNKVQRTKREKCKSDYDAAVRHASKTCKDTNDQETRAYQKRQREEKEQSQKKSSGASTREEKAVQLDQMKARHTKELEELRQTQQERLRTNLHQLKSDYDKVMESMEWEFLREHQQLRRDIEAKRDALAWQVLESQHQLRLQHTRERFVLLRRHMTARHEKENERLQAEFALERQKLAARQAKHRKLQPRDLDNMYRVRREMFRKTFELPDLSKLTQEEVEEKLREFDNNERNRRKEDKQDLEQRLQRQTDHLHQTQTARAQETEQLQKEKKKSLVEKETFEYAQLEKLFAQEKVILEEELQQKNEELEAEQSKEVPHNGPEDSSFRLSTFRDFRASFSGSFKFASSSTSPTSSSPFSSFSSHHNRQSQISSFGVSSTQSAHPSHESSSSKP